MKIEIRNCNNIRKADIQLRNEALNIMYGVNGTGKSTIAMALEEKLNGNLDSLKPYDEMQFGDDGPSVECDGIHTVSVFNEKYISQYVVSKDEIDIQNAFGVFIKTADISRQQKNLEDELRELHDFSYSYKNKEIGEEKVLSITDLLNYLNGLNDLIKTKSKGKEISATCKIASVIKGEGVPKVNNPELKRFNAFYQKDFDFRNKWSSWRKKGEDYIVDNKCPYCAKKLDDIKPGDEIATYNEEKIKEAFNKAFNQKGMKAEHDLEEFLSFGENNALINKEKTLQIKENIGKEGNEDILKSKMVELYCETIYIERQLEKVRNFDCLKVKKENLTDLKNVLAEMKINKSEIPEFYSTNAFSNFADGMNKKIEFLISQVSALKTAFGKYNREIEKIVSSRKDDINDFMRLAGMPYDFGIRVGDNENDTMIYLTPHASEGYDKSKEQTHVSVKERLSWGERNTFALILFMYEAIAKNSDLIILDDPISSFDETKKFAVMNRLLGKRYRGNNFFNKTVLYITHDLQPLIDFVYVGNLRYEDTNSVCASEVMNINGELLFRQIEQTDLKNVISQSKELYQNDSYPLAIRIVNLRRFIELNGTQPDFQSAYEVTSNLIHGRVIPQDKDGNKLTADFIKEGIKKIQEELKIEKDPLPYTWLLSELSGPKLLELYNTNESPYVQIIAVRLILERTRLLEDKSKDLYNKLWRKYPYACKFINEKCHVENDYVFNLSYLDYVEFPDIYKQDIDKLLKKNESVIKEI